MSPPKSKRNPKRARELRERKSKWSQKNKRLPDEVSYEDGVKVTRIRYVPRRDDE
jgi:hypothetical protein